MSTFLLFITYGVVTFCWSIPLASFFEWTLHRFVMHKPLGKFDYAFKAHALVHHHIFKADHTYHLINEPDKKTIPMAWWNGPVLILMCTLFFAVVPIMFINLIQGFWYVSTFRLWTTITGTFLAFAAYYATYEYSHYCMHLPRPKKLRLIEKWPLFHKINGHHLLHHRYMHRNFNVVLPLADFCLGTLLLRSKIKFPQPTGPTVPNVQPRAVRVG